MVKQIEAKKLILAEWYKWEKNNPKENPTELGALHFYAYLELHRKELLDSFNCRGDKYQKIKTWLREVGLIE